jgi:hypothetical protein
MLGLARASQYAGWWNQGQAPGIVNFAAAGDLGYTNRQTPSYSWLSDQDGNGGTSSYNFGLYYGASGDIDTTNYTTNTDYNAKRWTQVLSFKIHLPAGLASDEGIRNTPKIRNDSSNNFGTQAWIRAANNSLQITFYDSTMILPGSDYTDYNDTWYWLVWSGAETSSAFSSWTASQTSGTYYNRLALFDESGTLIQKQDDRLESVPGTTDITDWLTNAAGTVYTDNNDTNDNSYSVGWMTTQTNASCTQRNGVYWYSWGTMFDPLTESDTSWRTTRPSATIGTAVAWQNIQFVDYENPTAGNYYITAQGADLWTQVDDLEGRLMETGNAALFTDRYSTTDTPADKG